ncbi:MAG: AAA-like domain-containing protein [Nostoc sp.]|uniref:AAA-like domain-containing protein n=1 Tax=Nostoc sp. TaxID=1180 RepID=UPI002FFD1B9A
MTSTSASRYQVGGALLQDVPSYVTRESDRQLFEALKAGEFCYVLNSRQMGKSSLMVRTFAQLQGAGWKGIILDFSAKDSQSDQPNLWYNGIINDLNKDFQLLERKDFLKWLKERDFIAPVERLGEFIETVLLPGIIQPIVIFVDEIDSTLGLPFTDDFFALIRACYNKRAEKPDYKRLTFALLGVAAPSDLIGDTKRTPFNIGKGIDLSGFTLAEAQPLADGLAEKSENPQAVLQAIFHWTGGQPFLSQRLCQLMADSRDNLVAGSEASVVEGLVRSHLIENWESQDQQSHLKTISKRILDNEQKAPYLLELYRQTRQAGSLPVQNRPEDQELQLSGIVIKRNGSLQVYNPIYAAVFDESWIDAELGKLRPYAENFRAWVLSRKTDKSRLLRGDALKEAEQWAREKNPSGEDQDFLSASRTQEREEEIAAKEQTAELERERKNTEIAEKANKQLRQKTLIGTAIGGVILVTALIWAGFLAVKAKKQVEIANQAENKAQQADKKVQNLNSQLDSKGKELTSKQTQLTNAEEEEVAKKRTEANRAGEAAQAAQQKADQAQQAAQKAQQELGVATEEKEKLRQKAEQLKQEAQEAGTKAGLSTLLENEELKEAWLLAATAEAEAAKDKDKKTKEAQHFVKQSLNSLKNSKAQLDPRIFNQVSAFAYFMDGQLNNDNEQDYRAAYNALKDSKFDPYNPKTETDILTEKDVELIHYKLIKSAKIDINSEKDPIAISFRQHLYKGLDSLLKQDRLKDADEKTTEIMLYIADRIDDGYFTEESLKNFSCPALREIDAPWYNYPKRPQHFGFRVQKEIWQRNGSPTETEDSIERWQKFFIEVGWKTEKSGESRGFDVGYFDLGGFTDMMESRRGNLPTYMGVVVKVRGVKFKILLGGIVERKEEGLFFSRTANCNL